MFSSRKTLGSAALVSMLCVAAAVPAVSAAKTTKKITCVASGNKNDPNDVKATVSCPKPLGKGKQTGVLVLPNINGKWKFKGGGFKWASTEGKLVGSKATAKSSMTKGTGKFKGCTMKGSQSGDISTGKVTFKLTYTCK